jgi:N-acetylornithine carbamoyltransferase
VTKRDFLALEDWKPDEIEELLILASRVKRGEVSGGLEKKVLALVLMDPSLRTRTSFEIAMFLHGGHSVVLELGQGGWTLETEPGAVMENAATEHVVDAARVLGRYADAVGVRSISQGSSWEVARQDAVIKNFARQCEKPVINLGSVRRHPCQALADAMTLREKLGPLAGKRFVLTWAWHPGALTTAIPASAALAAARLGMEIVIARPEGYELDPEDTAMIRKAAQTAGGEVLHIVDDPDEGLVGADAVYVTSWASVKRFGQKEEEAELRAGLRDWKLTSARLRGTRGGKGIVMHSMPVRRNVEIDDKVLDGANSVVVDQAENRLHTQRALLLELIGEQRAQ